MTPFATTYLVVLDSIRIAVAAVGFLLVGIYLIRRWPTVGKAAPERARVFGMALALFVLAASRITNLGGPPTWQLYASMLVFALVGYSALAGPARWRE